jgi:hypothetical protein
MVVDFDAHLANLVGAIHELPLLDLLDAVKWQLNFSLSCSTFKVHAPLVIAKGKVPLNQLSFSSVQPTGIRRKYRID